MRIKLMAIFAAFDYTDVFFIGFVLAIILFVLIGLFIFGWWLNGQKDSVSPYTGHLLRRGSDLSYYSKERILRFLYEMHQYDNRIFEIRKAAVCRETGRIFPNALTWYDRVKVDWSFLQKRYPGHYVSWGSLSDFQKEHVMMHHHTLKDFQIEVSSPTSSPRFIEREYAYTKPGPLYVDLDTYVLLGWKCVPRTNFEVLVVQKPKGIFEIRQDS
jgi:hypothetical protein